VHPDAVASAVAGFAQAATVFIRPNASSIPFAHPLAERITRVARTLGVSVRADQVLSCHNDTRAFVACCRELNVTPRAAQNHARPGGSSLDRRTTGEVFRSDSSVALQIRATTSFFIAAH